MTHRYCCIIYLLHIVFMYSTIILLISLDILFVEEHKWLFMPPQNRLFINCIFLLLHVFLHLQDVGIFLFHNFSNLKKGYFILLS